MQGVEVARSFHADVVGPLLRDRLPDVPYAAARLGTGSDVLGLDDVVSRDHDWGRRLVVLVADDLVAPVRAAVERLDEPGLAVDSPSSFVRAHLGFDPRDGVSRVDWLSLTGQAALQVVAGEVFVDGTGELTSIRDALGWYPHDLWAHLVACDWMRLDQELPLMGRAGQRGDDLGSCVIAARLVDVAVHLGFLLERRWAPYPKWRGTAFARLPRAGAVAPLLGDVLAAASWEQRQERLGVALDALLAVQREAGLPTPSQALVPFWDRPFLQVDPDLLASDLGLPVGVGSIEQWCDNVDVLVHADRRRAAATSLLASRPPS